MTTVTRTTMITRMSTGTRTDRPLRGFLGSCARRRPPPGVNLFGPDC